MPLKLIGKKSWNPYAPAAIERVRADEAAAEEHERKLDELRDRHDAAVRLAKLRGEPEPSVPDELLELEAQDPSRGAKRIHDNSRKDDRRKRRRLDGEDDTERDIRLAREDAVESSGQCEKSNSPNDQSIVDRDGHIQLFAPDEGTDNSKQAKNPEAEAEKAKQQRQLEDQHRMRLSNAAGYRQGLGDSPWYLNDPSQPTETTGRNAFGKEDEGRHRRDAARATAQDPMSAINAAQSKIKALQRSRAEERAEREEALRSLKSEQRREERRSRHKSSHHNDPDVLDGFSLDHADVKERPPDRDHRHEHRHRHHQRHESPRRHESRTKERRHHRSSGESRPHRHRHSSPRQHDHESRRRSSRDRH